MCTQELKIGTIPAVLYGKPAPNIWLFVHGQGGNKTEAAAFAALAAPTGWQVLERFGNFTYIACKLKTGRTHQIRVHMASIGHPLAGDAVYGPKNCIRSLNGQCLHAKELGFVHPATGEWMQFDSSLPDWFQDYLSHLRKESRHGAFE